jgi:hypothetical protein
MKCHVTKRELLAVATFMVPKPTANLEQAHVRTQAWDELGMRDLALDIAEMVSVQTPFDPKPWVSKTPQLVDLTPPVVDFLLKQMEGEIPGMFTEVLRPFQDRLVSLRDKTYKLPQELRQGKDKTNLESVPAEK